MASRSPAIRLMDREGIRALLPPIERVELVVIASSAGATQPLLHVLSALPRDFPVPIAVVQHRPDSRWPELRDLVAHQTGLRVKIAASGERLQAGTVYLTPADLYLTLQRGGSLSLTDGRHIKRVLSSTESLFESAARALHGTVVAVLLAGAGASGADGVQAVRDGGGTVIAEDIGTAHHLTVPDSAIATDPWYVMLPAQEIAPALVELTRARGTQP